MASARWVCALLLLAVLAAVAASAQSFNNDTNSNTSSNNNSAAAVEAAVATPQLAGVNALELPINANPPFNVTTAERHLFYSYASYCPTDLIKTWKCYFCKGSVILLDTIYDTRFNAFAFVVYDPTHAEIVVTYRGTQLVSIKNWIEDLKFWKADTEFDGLPNARVAKGFYECQKILSTGVTLAVRKGLSLYPRARVVVTGHSLGGAMATLSALDLRVMFGISIDGVYTYGAPRVGNLGFSNQFAAQLPNATAWRMVNARDIVPHLPPFAFDFHHTPQEVWEHNQKYQFCNGGEDPKCSDSVILPVLVDSIFDHVHYMGVNGGFCLNAAGESVNNDLSLEAPEHAAGPGHVPIFA